MASPNPQKRRASSLPARPDRSRPASVVVAIVAGLMLMAAGSSRLSAQALQITKLPASQEVVEGAQASFTIRVTNGGSTTLTGISVSDPLTPNCAQGVRDLPAGQFEEYTCFTGPLTSGFTNVATASALGQSDVSASAVVTVLEKIIQITKTPDIQQVASGGTAAFSITVENVSDETSFDNVSVSDPLAPDCNRSSSTFGTMGPGDSETYTCTKSAVTVSFTNVATVTADEADLLFGKVLAGDFSDSDSAEVEVLGASVQILKSPASQSVVSGGTATFQITVRNTGDLDLTSVSVSDPQAPNCDRAAAFFGTLAPSAARTYSCTKTGVTASFTNTATVNASSTAGPVSGSANATVTLVPASIQITKLPATQTIAAGGLASFTIRVTNPMASGTLTNVAVADAEVLSCGRVSGTSCGSTIPDLGPGEFCEYVCSEVRSESFTNTATATATFMSSTVSASASAQVTVQNTLEIDKSPAEQAVFVGGTATFTIKVTNNGAGTLTGVTVTDALTPACNKSIGTLGPGAMDTYICATGTLTADLTNTAKVTANPGALMSQDTAFVNVALPKLAIAKTPAGQLVAPGGKASFTITVRNDGDPGDPAVSGIQVQDILSPDCARTSGIPDLAPGESSSYACQSAAVTASFTNTAKATGTGPSGVAVAATGTANVTVQNPLDITKIPATQTRDPGATAGFTITVRNSGSEDLSNVVVADPLSPNCARNLGDLPAGGGPVSYSCTSPVLTAPFTNEAKVTATSPSGPLERTASAVVNLTSGSTSFTVVTATGTGNATIEFTPNGSCTFDGAQALPVDSVGTPPPPGVIFNDGLFSFTVSGCTPGATLDFTLTLPSAPPVGTQYWKFGPTPSNSTPAWYVLPGASIVGNVVSFSITDGGIGDHDLIANGEIDDPGGPGGPMAVPALPPLALVTMALALAGMGLWSLRRRRVT